MIELSHASLYMSYMSYTNYFLIQVGISSKYNVFSSHYCSHFGMWWTWWLDFPRSTCTHPQTSAMPSLTHELCS